MADFEKLLESLKVWGKWGADDERGALNYITDATRRDAARLVKSGRTFSLALPLTHGKGPQTGRGGRSNLLHFMTATGCDPAGLVELGADARYTDDYIAMTVQASTQWDALCHIYYRETLYNGYPASSVSSRGADKNGIDKVHADFVSRGVLLDIARSKGVGCLDATENTYTKTIIDYSYGVIFVFQFLDLNKIGAILIGVKYTICNHDSKA